MQQFFAEPSWIEENRILMRGADVNHMKNVLRMKPGEDVRINDGGHYAPGGYVADNRSSFIEHYTGRDDIPDEHRVFSMPKLSIREQMSTFKEIIDRSSLEGERKRPTLGHTE